VITHLFKYEAFIDPQSALAPMWTILQLDDLGIYGERIWILYKYICEQNIINLVALMRSIQLGVYRYEICNQIKLFKECKFDEVKKVDFGDLKIKLLERLDKFNFDLVVGR